MLRLAELAVSGSWGIIGCLWDARDRSSYQLLISGGKATFAFADPPYNVPINGHVCGVGARHREFAMACGDMTSGSFRRFSENGIWSFGHAHATVRSTTCTSISGISMR